jgi:hypothetical protein
MIAAATTMEVNTRMSGRKSKKYPVYVYPARNPLYAQFVERYTQRNDAPTPIKQPQMRKLVYEAFPLAKEEFDEWMLRREADPQTPMIIPDLTGSCQRTPRPYNVYLNEHDESQAPIVAYIKALKPKDRQLFFNLLFVRGMDVPDIERYLDGL